MATEVVREKELTLDDGTNVTLRPLVISRKRKFMKVWNGYMDEIVEIANKMRAAGENGESEDLSGIDMSNKEFDVLIELSVICLSGKIKDKNDEELKSYLEDNLTEPDIHDILEVCGGIKLDDPKENNSQMTTQMGSGGTN